MLSFNFVYNNKADLLNLNFKKTLVWEGGLKVMKTKCESLRQNLPLKGDEILILNDGFN